MLFSDAWLQRRTQVGVTDLGALFIVNIRFQSIYHLKGVLRPGEEYQLTYVSKIRV